MKREQYRHKIKEHGDSNVFKREKKKGIKEETEKVHGAA